MREQSRRAPGQSNVAAKDKKWHRFGSKSGDIGGSGNDTRDSTGRGQVASIDAGRSRQRSGGGGGGGGGDRGISSPPSGEAESSSGAAGRGRRWREIGAKSMKFLTSKTPFAASSASAGSGGGGGGGSTNACRSRQGSVGGGGGGRVGGGGGERRKGSSHPGDADPSEAAARGRRWREIGAKSLKLLTSKTPFAASSADVGSGGGGSTNGPAGRGSYEQVDRRNVSGSREGGDGGNKRAKCACACPARKPSRRSVAIVATVFLILAATATGIFLWMHFSSRAASFLVVPYSVLTSADLPPPNPAAASTNPLRGFITSPDWMDKPEITTIPSSMDYYSIGLNKVMDGPDSFPGLDTFLEPRIRSTASKSRHVVLRFILDEPAVSTHVPQFLIDGGLKFDTYTAHGGGMSPDYSDENLLTALELFITEVGRRYDGDPRIGFVQVGLLGFWGEWHTYTETRDEGWITESAKWRVLDSFDDAFSYTRLQARTPHTRAVGLGGKFGLHDDSFTFATVDGEPNGGVSMDWFFWPSVVRAGFVDFWKRSAMSGELYPPQQGEVFDPSYSAGTEHKQPFDVCVRTTHATFLINHHAFYTGYGGEALVNARAGSDSLGYAFQMTGVEARHEGEAEDETVDITITIVQVGVAPFYYPLTVSLRCEDHLGYGPIFITAYGVDRLLERGEEGHFTFRDVPATESCLGAITFQLNSAYEFPNRPIKFAQGGDGTVVANLPIPPALRSIKKSSKTSPLSSTEALEGEKRHDLRGQRQ